MPLRLYQQQILKNKYQGPQKKALCVCSVGMLRSPTLAFLLNLLYDMNARSCGTDEDALIPISEKLVYWADIIFVIGSDNLPEVKNLLDSCGYGREIHLIDIEDDYEYMQPELGIELKKVLKTILG